MNRRQGRSDGNWEKKEVYQRLGGQPCGGQEREERWKRTQTRKKNMEGMTSFPLALLVYSRRIYRLFVAKTIASPGKALRPLYKLYFVPIQ